MAKPKKRKSLLQSQREKLARQRAARRAAQKAARDLATSNRRSLPGKGRTTATSPRARVQRGLTRDRLAKQQLQNFGRALQRTMKQRNAQNKAEQAARGTRGTVTRTAGGAGQLARRGGGSSSPTSQRIQPVRVRVDGQKQLPAGKKPAGQLPTKTTQKTQPVGKASARRAQAAAKQARAAQGSKGPNRVGQPAGAANRYYGKKVVDKAVNRAVNRTRLRGVAGAAGSLAAQSAGLEIASKLAQTIGKPGQSRMSKLGIAGPAKRKPARRGMSNIPAGEGTGKGSPNDKKKSPTSPKKSSVGTSTPKAGKAPVVAASRTRRNNTTDVPSNSKKNPYRMPEGDEREDKSFKAVEDLKGMVKESKARQNAQMPKKPKKKTISRNEMNKRRRQGRY